MNEKNAFFVFLFFIMGEVVFALPIIAGAEDSYGLVEEVIQKNTENFPNNSVRLHFVYSLDVNGSCDLSYFVSIVSETNASIWTPENPYNAIIRLRSSSDEKARYQNWGDERYFYPDYEPVPYGDGTYFHTFCLACRPAETPKALPEYAKSSLTPFALKVEINNSCGKRGDLYTFFVPHYYVSDEIESVMIRINLPNDPYNWSQSKYFSPQFNYSYPWGTGESYVWIFGNDCNITEPIEIFYEIQADPIKESIDNSTKNSEQLGIKANWLGWIAITISVVSVIISIGLGLLSVYYSRKKERTESKETKEKSKAKKAKVKR
jgi:hypothetical protein